MSKASEIMSRFDKSESKSLTNAIKAIEGEDYKKSLISNKKVFEDIRDALREAFEELEARAMPEGYEWPRYEDGELVPIGGEFMGKDGKTYTAKQIQFIGKCFSLYDFCDRKPQFSGFYGERVKRPKAIASDGEPLETGQTVWNVNNGMEFTVIRLPKPGEYQAVEVRYRNGSSTSFDPDQLTHHRPVLDADGVPIKVGDTVYLCDKYRDYAGSITSMCVMIGIHRDTCLHVMKVDDYRLKFDECLASCPPDWVTHEHPDSWERIEEDKDLNPFDYCKKVGHKLWTFDNAEEFKASDLVRRCKALAERDAS